MYEILSTYKFVFNIIIILKHVCDFVLLILFVNNFEHNKKLIIFTKLKLNR